ncbi:MAG: BatA and WFA domain-containing protein [candidate division KSB1 bacterium]|nr:BatA and WFA domain-containing protein [candidate division KSB1 bacterium]MDZ7302802.1 BatA and WFA domain-containing protein [candidate division KSB1 bacterium]MDZ7311819.1 BatA and WFA domain-containing protein [candidate division KSB1 bacterium]
MFSFINTALLWALAAITLPLLIHLLTRRKLRVVTVSTIAFLKRLEKEKIRQLRLRQLLLLLLRMLIVALLVLAFTRPTLRHQQATLAQRAAATAVVIIDNSLSMAAAPDGVSLLAQARQQAQRLAGLFAPGDEIFLITAAKPARLVSANALFAPERFSEITASVPQTSAETDLAGAIALAREKLASSRNVNRELYVFTDARAALPVASVQSSHAAAKSTTDNMGSIRGFRGYVIRFDKTPGSNLTLQSATLSNQIFERGKAFEVVAAVANNGQRDLNNQLVHLFLNGKRVAQQTVDVPAGAERRVVFRATPEAAGFIFGRIELEDDDLPLDNVRSFVVFIPPQRRVLAVAGNPEDLTYLRLAFDPSNRISSESQITNTWREIAAINLAAERFENYDGIVLANVPRLTEAVAQRLSNYLKNGGGMMLFLGSDLDLRNYNELLLTPLKVGAFGETMGQLTSGGIQSAGDHVIKLGRIDFSHPVFNGIFEKSEKAPRLDSPLFRFAVQMRLANGTVPIMEYANAYPFLVERRVGSGLLLIFTSAATEQWSDFAFKGLFAPLIHRCIAYMTQNRDNLRESQLVGEEIVTSLRGTVTAVEMEMPDGERRKLPVEVVGQNYQVRLTDVEQPGQYRLWQVGLDSLARVEKQLPFMPVGVWAVNFNPVELKLPVLSDQAFKTAMGTDAVVLISPEADLVTAVRQARYGSELWRYFLVAAIIAMLTEMWLSRSTQPAKTSIAKSVSQETAAMPSV